MTPRKKKEEKTKGNLSVVLETADPKQRKILGERARELAETVEVQETGTDLVEVVEFVLAYEKYAIESVHVSEVYPMKEFTILPGTPSFVLGIINLRGSILTVVDIRGFFGLPVEGISNLNRIVVVETPQMKLGILADFILGVRSIQSDKIQLSLPTLTGIRAEYIRGVTADRLVILDILKIVDDKKLLIHQVVE